MTRTRYIVIALMSAVLLAVGAVLGGDGVTAQTIATPAPAFPLFSGEGITSAKLAQDFPILKTGNATNLVLRRWTLQPGATSPVEVSRLPELGYVASGSIAYDDAFGTPAVADTGSVITVSPGIAGAHSQMTNNETAPAVVLVLSYFALPADAASMSTPDDQGFQSETLVDGMTGPFPGDDLATFIGVATFAPGAQTASLAHNGPVCLYVDDGDLEIADMTPSDGAGENQSGCLTATAPLQISNSSDSPATVLIIGAIQGTGLMGNFFSPVKGTPTASSG